MKAGTEKVRECAGDDGFGQAAVFQQLFGFFTRYTAVSSTNIKTQTAEYYALEQDDGLTMNLGVNPLLQFGLEETRKVLLTNILNDLSVIRYVAFDSDTIGPGTGFG